ncbi:MAG: molybdate transporter substrate-binding protein [Rubritepida sp.]|nr:molybdate transporter substrate-binding protein [Rubritepida sp.]
MSDRSEGLKIFSTLGVVGVLGELLPEYERAAGIRIEMVYEPTKKLQERIAAGETADAAILTGEAIDELTQQGVLASDWRVDLARSFVGVAVGAGKPRPEIGTVEAFKRTLLEAKTIAYSKAGASGIFFAGLIQRLGLAEAVNAKATIIPSGFTGELLLKGEVEIAIQQISELMAVPGIDIVGRLPAEIQADTIFSAGLFPASDRQDAAAAFLRAISGPETAEVYTRLGLEPIAQAG